MEWSIYGIKCYVHDAWRHYETTVLLGYFNMPQGIAHHSSYMWFNSFFELRCKHVLKKKKRSRPKANRAALNLSQIHVKFSWHHYPFPLETSEFSWLIKKSGKKTVKTKQENSVGPSTFQPFGPCPGYLQKRRQNHIKLFFQHCSAL